jgi:hypothetical protein
MRDESMTFTERQAPSLNRRGVWVCGYLAQMMYTWGSCWVEMRNGSCAGLPLPALPAGTALPVSTYSPSSSVQGTTYSTLVSSGNHWFDTTPITYPTPSCPKLMPTIASSVPPPLPPGDADLQELYDQVLSAFAEESSPSNFSPTFSMSRSNNIDRDSPRSDEGVGSQVSSRPLPQSRGQSLPLFLSSFFSYLSSSLS